MAAARMPTRTLDAPPPLAKVEGATRQQETAGDRIGTPRKLMTFPRTDVRLGPEWRRGQTAIDAALVARRRGWHNPAFSTEKEGTGSWVLQRLAKPSKRSGIGRSTKAEVCKDPRCPPGSSAASSSTTRCSA